MEDKYTPGQWEVAETSEGYQVVACVTPTGHVVVARDVSDEADAHLIAAAPDLLEACRYIVEAGENGDEIMAIEKARAAISRASR